MKKYIPLLLLLSAGAISSLPTPALATSGDQSQMQAAKLDLNSATLAQLTALPGIGERKAQAIIDYRDEVGRFVEVEQLTEVKGIGEKMLAKLAGHLTVREH
ncbi:helix-hairpin-helix domain-containing protein [Alteromonas sp. ASW11-19]|uniref:Helix-hairpin-helix domain-containing protein n=1 Tax=Alteromonas salexigens TaxID=2982530 RepID=A0ABT2VRQ6_9ALTE|nr:helix-hairpin-helix domain-containing protein [Alteromonas salexigens]MCU7554906.1 helix-hairpin-helix domain-containing protein [Alteromonas salexigens]